MSRKYQVAAYYFPQWHVDPQNRAAHGGDWCEWESLKKAVPRFPGHEQPKVPLWGYLDESNPAVSQKQIDAAADHGIDVFLYDWYWDMGPSGTTTSGPFLHRALEEGFLQAPNRNRLQFALMWANHKPVNRQRFDVMTDYIIKEYLHQPNYWLVNDGLFFCIYELFTLIEGLGGLSETKEALDSFRQKVKSAGLPPLHIDAMEWGLGKGVPLSKKEAITFFEFDSVTSYVWCHNLAMPYFPATEYREYMSGAPALWEEIHKACKSVDVPYFPNVTMGWDPSPRVPAELAYTKENAEKEDYPITPILQNNLPEYFEQSLRQAKKFIDDKDIQPGIITLYAWNEWTEGGYLEPDSTHGMAYLEAIRRVFRERD